MRLQKLETRNFRQHKNIDVNFSGNLIGVVGPNGSGKSNLLGAIQYGLVGEVTGVNKDKLITWGEKNGYIKLTVDDIIITRDFINYAELLMPDGTKVIGTTKVNNKVQEIFGLDKDLARQTIFVRQAEIDNILFETPCKREQSFQKLCGMGNSSVIYKKLGDYFMDNFKSKPNYDEQLKAAKDKLQKVQHDISDINTKIASINIPADYEIDSAKRKWTSIDLLLYHINSLNNLHTCLKDNDLEINKLKLDLDSVSKKIVDNLSLVNCHSIGEIDLQIVGARSILTGLNSIEQIEQKLNEYKTRLKELETINTNSEKVEQAKEEYQKVSSICEEYAANIKILETVLLAISDAKNLAICPICESSIKEPEKIQKKLVNKIDKISKEHVLAGDKLEELSKVYLDLSNNYNTYTSDSKKYDWLIKESQNLLNKHKQECNVSASSNDILSVIAEMEQIKRDIITLLESKKEIDYRLTNRTDKSDEYKKAIQELTIKIENIRKDTGFTDIGYNTISYEKTKLDNYLTEVNTNIAIKRGYESELALLNKSVVELEDLVRDLLVKQTEVANYDKALTVLNNVRDWFHYSAGPRTLSANILTGMIADINSFLSKLDAPFFITPKVDEGLAFNCVFYDGRADKSDVIPEADDLSGGEKILLATSFRLSGYCMFANQLGLLSLDEPTVYLDDAHIVKFCEFLAKIKKVVVDLNLQLIMATHEVSVKPYFDTVIDLS